MVGLIGVATKSVRLLGYGPMASYDDLWERHFERLVPCQFNCVASGAFIPSRLYKRGSSSSS
jgi:hypothetical protein